MSLTSDFLKCWSFPLKVAGQAGKEIGKEMVRQILTPTKKTSKRKKKRGH